MRKYFSFFIFYYYVIKRSPKRYNISVSGQLNQFYIVMTPLILWILSMIVFLIIGHGWATGVFIGLGAVMVINFVYSTTVYREAFEIEREIANERYRLAEEERQRKMDEERRRRKEQQEAEWEAERERRAEERRRERQREYQEEQKRKTYSNFMGGGSSSFGGMGGKSSASGKSREQEEAEERLRKFAEQFNSEEFNRAQEEARRRAEQQRKRTDSQYNHIANQFAILGIEPTKDLDVIKKAYRKKAKQYHPDTGGDAEMFKKITKANEEILKFVKSI